MDTKTWTAFAATLGTDKGESKFTAWMSKVDAAISTKCGLTSSDLPDCCYRDWHDDGLSATRAAARAIKYANEG